MTTAEDIEKADIQGAIESYDNQLVASTRVRDYLRRLLDLQEDHCKWLRDQIQGLRKMEIERERNGN